MTDNARDETLAEREACAQMMDGFAKNETGQNAYYYKCAAASIRARGAAPPATDTEDWRDDPSADERWNAGLDYGMVQLCKFLSVVPNSIRWDSATETLDGDVQDSISKILTARFGEDFDFRAAPPVPTSNARDETLADDLHDVVTHRSAWRSALIECRERSKSFTDDADESYWEHELKAFDRTFDKLAALRAAPPATDDRNERDMLQLIDERDAAQEAVSDIYYMLTGRSPEWSNNFGFKECLEELTEARQLLGDAAAPPATDTGMREALEDGQRDVVIDYTNYRGERSYRKVIPLRWEFAETEWHPGKQWIMWAQDTDRGVTRAFAMDCIHSWNREVAALSRPPQVADTREGDA